MTQTLNPTDAAESRRHAMATHHTVDAAAESADLQDLGELVRRVRSAWDQYTIQARLPEDGRWRTQGHSWDSYNTRRPFTQARRDPLAMGAAWNAVEEGLGEVSAALDRLRAHARPAGRREQPEPFAILGRAGWPDRRVGAYSAAAVPATQGATG